jgi:Mg2+ and Co2+ transporter CorA
MHRHWINYALLDDITDKYAPLINSIELEVDAIDDLVLVISQSEQADMLRRIANARKRVMTLQRLLVTKSDVLRMLIKRLEAAGTSTEMIVYSGMLRDTCLYLGDVQDRAFLFWGRFDCRCNYDGADVVACRYDFDPQSLQLLGANQYRNHTVIG